MPSFLPDSNCMIAAASVWHVHHEAAAAEIDRRLDNGESLILAAPSLLETYAVLTRLPVPYQLTPAECLAVLQSSFIGNAERIVALTTEAYINLVHRAAADGITGRRIYDAVIATCGLTANVATLLTFNFRDFQPFAGQSMTIVVPQADV